MQTRRNWLVLKHFFPIVACYKWHGGAELPVHKYVILVTYFCHQRCFGNVFVICFDPVCANLDKCLIVSIVDECSQMVTNTDKFVLVLVWKDEDIFWCYFCINLWILVVFKSQQLNVQQVWSRDNMFLTCSFPHFALSCSRTV